MKATSLLVLWVSFSGLTLGLVGDHYFVDQLMTWWEARDYCRQHYTDLSSIPNQKINNILGKTIQESGRDHSWIGLRRCTDYDCDYWYWSDGTRSKYRNWDYSQPSGSQDCVEMMKNGKWDDDHCNKKMPFFCVWWHREFILVMEKMEWEEALLHCREHYTDLASMLTPRERDLADARANGTQTDQVWTSLHFLAGQWLWVNERGTGKWEFTQGALPNCPAQPYSCGARSPGLGRWENRDCQERLNFLCYRA